MREFCVTLGDILLGEKILALSNCPLRPVLVKIGEIAGYLLFLRNLLL
jgi:hypothetical protein